MSLSQANNDQACDEFTELSGRYQLQLMGFIYSMVRSMNDAEDVYQQTSIVMWRKFDEYAPGSDFLKWACTIARYEALNFIRSRENRSRYFSDDYLQQCVEIPTQKDADRIEARQQALAGCLERLKRRDQQLVMRCYCGSGNIQDVAKEMGRPPESVSNSLRRIRRALHDCINRTLATEGAYD